MLNDEVTDKLRNLDLYYTTLPSLADPRDSRQVKLLIQWLAKIEAEAGELLKAVTVDAVGEKILTVTDAAEAGGVQRPQVYRWQKQVAEEKAETTAMNLFPGIGD